MARRTSPAERMVMPSTFRFITLVVLVTQVTIVLTGAAVRLTGSGLGCSDWPNCEQDRFVPSTEYHAVIEFVNRMVSGPVLIAVLFAIWGARRRIPHRPELEAMSWVILGGVVIQVFVGAVVVRLELLPSTVILHFLLSMALLWASVVLHHRAGQDLPDTEEEAVAARAAARWQPEWSRLLASALVVWATVVLVTGTVVTGSGPHGGDENAARLDVFLPTAARTHAVTVWIFLALLVATLAALRSERAPAAVQRAGVVILAVSLAQGAIGYIQYANGVPAPLVFGHIIGAMAVWGTTVWFWLEHRRGTELSDEISPDPVPTGGER